MYIGASVSRLTGQPLYRTWPIRSVNGLAPACELCDCVVLHCFFLQSVCHSYRGHSSHVTTVRFMCDDSRLLSLGGKDSAILQWQVVDAAFWNWSSSMFIYCLFWVPFILSLDVLFDVWLTREINEQLAWKIAFMKVPLITNAILTILLCCLLFHSFLISNRVRDGGNTKQTWRNEDFNRNMIEDGVGVEATVASRKRCERRKFW